MRRTTLPGRPGFPGLLVRFGHLGLPVLLGAAAASAAALPLSPCRLPGLEREAACGRLQRPLDPARPDGPKIDLHFAVLPAVARPKKPDPVFFLAGGPGQSAIELAGPVSRLLVRLSNRRDLVLIDQRGTGRSAPLKCEEDRPTRPLAELASLQRQADKLGQCLAALQKLPHGDLRHYTTPVAVQDADAVRAALGAAQVNLVGGSYGTRVALEYMRQYPQRVRRMVIDGVAPPDMVLPASFSVDAQAAFDALRRDCERDPECRAAYPGLSEDWQALLKSLPRRVTLQHPLTRQDETLELTHEMVTGLVRLPLYVPSLASALPLAVTEAARGRLQALAGLASAVAPGGRRGALAQGMHYSVVCSEDAPLLERAVDAPGPDFGRAFEQLYRRACDAWPRGSVPQEFYRLGEASAASLVLSGGVDPVTPPRHGERVSRTLGPRARHVVVEQAGHGVLGLGCMRDVVFRFVDADDDTQALAVDAGCARTLPRPTVFKPVQAGGGK